MIRIEKLGFSYFDNVIFDDLNLTFHKGKFYALLGKNGSGKSTLIKLILGVEKANCGDIYVENEKISDDIIYSIRKKIGLVFQNPDEQIISDIIDEEVAFSMQNYGYLPDEMQKRIEILLKEVNLYHKRDCKISQFSGGEKQRLCIASSLSLNPKILILDEGTAMLDEKNRENILNLLKKIQDSKMTIIMISHHIDELKYADEVVFLNKNQKPWIGSVRDYIKNIIHNDADDSMELTPNLYIAKEIFKKRKIDISDFVFDTERIMDFLWQLRLTK